MQKRMLAHVDQFKKIVNYGLIGAVVVWILFGVSILIEQPFSWVSILLTVMLALLAYAVYGIWKYELTFYKLVLWITLINIALKWIAGMHINIEIVPLILTLYLMDVLFPKKQVEMEAV